MEMWTSISSGDYLCKNYISVCSLCLNAAECWEAVGVGAELLLGPSFAARMLGGSEVCCLQLPHHQREGTVHQVNNLLFP